LNDSIPASYVDNLIGPDTVSTIRGGAIVLPGGAGGHARDISIAAENFESSSVSVWIGKQ
jgi:hypothetical protein